MNVLVIVPKYDYLQISTYTGCYTCPTKIIDGESHFWFKGKWHKTMDYTTLNTRINEIGIDQ